ncbi:MAG TPA: hypothetical protein VFT45_02990, partial [Longimicrobium sp.]|nr:hypothetical protein [Longimicrobium sp.]
RIRTLSDASLERARRSAGAAGEQRSAMESLAATSHRAAAAAATLDALAGRFRAQGSAVEMEETAPGADVPARGREPLAHPGRLAGAQA